jgi:hypothetical protein
MTSEEPKRVKEYHGVTGPQRPRIANRGDF